MARLSWLAAILAEYVLPRPPVRVFLAVLGTTGVAAALVIENTRRAEPEKVVASYTVCLGAPTMAFPAESKTQDPAVDQAQPLPEAEPEPETEPEPEPVQADPQPIEERHEPVPSLVRPDHIEPVAGPAVPAVAAVKAEPAAATNNNVAVAKVETAEHGPAVAQTPVVAGILDAGKATAMDTPGSSGNMGQANTQGGSPDGIVPGYWMSVRDAVAREMVYPYRARSRGVEGRVVISLTLDKKGRVVKAESLSSDDDDDLVRAAVRGVMRASPFEAPQLALGESTITAQVPIQFRLVSEGNATN